MLARWCRPKYMRKHHGIHRIVLQIPLNNIEQVLLSLRQRFQSFKKPPTHDPIGNSSDRDVDPCLGCLTPINDLEMVDRSSDNVCRDVCHVCHVCPAFQSIPCVRSRATSCHLGAPWALSTWMDRGQPIETDGPQCHRQSEARRSKAN